MAKGKARRLTQSRSVANFKAFILERRTDDNLPQHIKGSALWKEIDDEEGYWVFDTLSNSYLAIEYEEDSAQWYFIQQDSRTGNWVAIVLRFGGRNCPTWTTWGSSDFEGP